MKLLLALAAIVAFLWIAESLLLFGAALYGYWRSGEESPAVAAPFELDEGIASHIPDGWTEWEVHQTLREIAVATPSDFGAVSA